MKRKPPSGDGPHDYEIGYRRPPVATRFRPGSIGNPRGRPKRKKTIGQSIEEALMAAHKIEENGRVKILTAQEIIIRNLIRTAARGNTRAIQTSFALRDRYHDSTQTTINMAELEREDQRLIEDYLGQLATATDGSVATSNHDTDTDEATTTGDEPPTTIEQTDRTAE